MATLHIATRYLRLTLSCTATALAVMFCVSQGHVHLTPGDPGTWPNLLGHRCGCLVVFCGAVTVLELLVTLSLHDELYGALEPLPGQ